MNQEIDSADCGANRHSRYECPTSCIFSPYHPDNYEQLLDIEIQLDQAILDQAARHSYFGTHLEKILSKPEKDEFIHGGKILKLLHEDRDENGETLFESWEKEGFNKLKNDTRVLLKHKQSMKVSLVELQQVEDDKTLTMIDLLEEGKQVYKVIDYSLAATACRFQTMMAYYYRVPGFFRFHAAGQGLPTLYGHTGLEAFLAVVEHLGGNTTQSWLFSNLERISDALEAARQFQQRKLLIKSNLRSAELTYDLRLQPDELADRLRSTPFTEGYPDPEASNQGYKYVFDYIRMTKDSAGAEMNQVLGNARIKQGFASLYSINADVMPEIRKVFEDALQDQVTFRREMIEDLSKQLADKLPVPDTSLVAPSFQTFDNRLSMDTSLADVPPRFSDNRELHKKQTESYYRKLMDLPVPDLDNKSPREASADFILRPKLVHWVKDLIYDTDRSNLNTGGNVDLDWMFNELGLDEIRVPPPPARPVPEPRGTHNAQDEYEDDYPDDDFEYSVDGSRVEKYVERVNQFLNDITASNEGLVRMKASGCNLMSILHTELDGEVSQKVRYMLDLFVPAIWYALGLEGQFLQIDSETLSDELDVIMYELEDILREGSPNSHELLADLCVDIDLFTAVVHLAETYQQEAPSLDKLSTSEFSNLIIHLLVVINVLAI